MRWRVARGLTLSALLVAALLGSWLHADRPVDDLRADLVARVNAFAPSGPRPRHGEPVTRGTMVTQLEAAYPNVVDVASEWPDAEVEPLFGLCAHVRDGAWPLDDLPPACAQLVEKDRDALQPLLDASRAEQLGDVTRLREMKWWPLATATTIVAIAARVDLEQRDDAAAALRACADLLGLYRDLVTGASLEERTAAASIVARSLSVCGDALAAAAPLDQRRAASAFEAIANGVVPLATAVRVEALEGELGLFGYELTASQQAELPAWAQRVLERADRFDPEPERAATPCVIAPFVIREPWVAYIETMEAIARATELAPPDAMAEIHQRLSDPELPDLTRAAAATNWTRHVAADHVARARLDLLRAAASAAVHHQDTGAWPDTLADPLVAGAELRIAAGRVSVHYAMPDGTARAPDAILLGSGP